MYADDPAAYYGSAFPLSNLLDITEATEGRIDWVGFETATIIDNHDHDDETQ